MELALVAVGGTLGGVVLGAWLEGHRADVAWKRQEQARWLGDLRHLLARYLQVIHVVWEAGKTWHLAMEKHERAVTEDGADPTKWDDTISDMGEKMLVFARSWGDIYAVAAEIDFIATLAHVTRLAKPVSLNHAVLEGPYGFRTWASAL
jgi:hypothetical protein